jgi:hypothetical protein
MIFIANIASNNSIFRVHTACTLYAGNKLLFITFELV